MKIRRSLAALLALFTGIASTLAAVTVTPLDGGRLAVEVTATGDSPEDAVNAARLEAVSAAAGRVLMGDRLILADELLSKYLDNYGPKFVTAVEVLDESFSAGQTVVEARVFVDYARLVKDLEEKTFLYKPAYKPRFVTFMSERLDGEVSEQGVAREALTQALNALGMRPYDNQLSTPPSTSDVTIDDLLLEAALISAQRAGIEVVVSGEVSTTLREKKQLYYEEFWFYDAEMSAALVRVDTGEVLFHAKAFGSASDKNPSNAIRLAIERASEQVAGSLTTDFEKLWPVVVQTKADYQVLLTGVDDETLRIVQQNVERLGRGVEVFVRKTFDRSAVLSVKYTGSKDELIENLKSCPYPTLNVVNPDGDRLFEVQVSG